MTIPELKTARANALGLVQVSRLALLTLPALALILVGHAAPEERGSIPQAQPAAPAPRGPVDSRRLEEIEDLSESLANDLLDLSVAVRDRDVRRMAEFVPTELCATPLPAVPLPARQEVKWVAGHGWEAAATQANEAQPGGPVSSRQCGAAMKVRATARNEFLDAWASLLAHFAEIEDARFKVKAAQFEDFARVVPSMKTPTAAPGSKGTARVAFYFIGRSIKGEREWTRGVANVSVERGSRRWQFHSFELLSLDSLHAGTDMFSEVSVPAGVAARRPPFGTPENSGFIWHGAAAADFNNDGWLDLFVTSPYRVYLYLNDGQGRFTDASESAGLGLFANPVAPLALDIDNDGDLDVFISAVGAQILLENRLVPDGQLAFRDVSAAAGVTVEAVGFSAVAGDVNLDGLPDIYVASYNHYGQVVPNSWYRATNGTRNLLFFNQGNGRFREEATRWGVDDNRWSYSAAFADVNEDGRPDLYVANDFGENALFINQGDQFVDEAASRGVLDPGYGMGVSIGDYDNDGRLDLHVTNMSSTAGNRILSRLFPGSGPGQNVLVKLAAGNNLYRNRGEGRFEDVTDRVGPFSGGWAWGGGFIDIDNDGWEDMFTPNGFISGRSMKDT